MHGHPPFAMRTARGSNAEGVYGAIAPMTGSVFTRRDGPSLSTGLTESSSPATQLDLRLRLKGRLCRGGTPVACLGSAAPRSADRPFLMRNDRGMTGPDTGQSAGGPDRRDRQHSSELGQRVQRCANPRGAKNTSVDLILRKVWRARSIIPADECTTSAGH